MLISNLIPGEPVLSWLLVIIAANIILYFIRVSAHHLFDSLTRLVVQNLKLLSHALIKSARQLNHRNREVLLEHGKQQAERELERQFLRLSNLVEKDLARYPTIQRNIEQNISHMEDKLAQTSQVPPPAPDWTEAVESISKLKDATKNDAVVGKLLQAIFEAFQKQQGEVLTTHRQDIAKRHNLLKDAMGHWRHVLSKVTRLSEQWQNLIQQAKKIDLQVERFDNMVQGTDKAERLLKASNTTQFFISVVVMAIAGFGAFVNYNLIALPMSELMPATSQIAGYDVADIGAAVIIMLEITVGLFFMEAIGITRLFPVIHFMEDKKRLIFAWLCMIFLLALCGVEAGLAYMRETMVADKALLTSFLVGGEQAATAAASVEHSNIPMIGQMTLGFVLPLILMFVAIPFESFIHTGRHVLGGLTVNLCIFTSTILRSSAIFINQINQSIKHIYDILCFAPLWFEHLVDSKPKKKQEFQPEQNNHVIQPIEHDNQPQLDSTKSIKQEV
ncbi:hypothetical protein NBRC116188_12220 [Oceaniserpentilla sp. 4NH20-0058]|uniref:hypothetical protein n=1 Tax=Oceaniserpentilla sp. 4NH20-0058 TaxID=3127660 RepID=UPI00310B7962